MKKAVVIVKKFLDSNKEARVDAYAAQAAFYIIMGAIPFLMLLLILLQYTPMTKEDLLNVLAEILPGVFRSYLADLVNGIYVTNTALLSGTAIAALWASGRTAMAISNGLNSVCGILDRRNYVVSRLRAAWYMFLLAAVSGDGTGASGVWKYCAWMVHWKSSGDGTVFGSYHLDAHRWCSGGIDHFAVGHVCLYAQY